jgi:hypothetical protein
MDIDYPLGMSSKNAGEEVVVEERQGQSEG